MPGIKTGPQGGMAYPGGRDSVGMMGFGKHLSVIEKPLQAAVEIVFETLHVISAPLVNHNQKNQFGSVTVRGHQDAGKVQGYQGIQLFRRPLGDEVEFITIMWFESWEAVKEFAGEDYERAYVPPKARAVLSRFDERSQHYEIREKLEY